jgi:tRNA(Ile)-lysidine synthase
MVQSRILSQVSVVKGASPQLPSFLCSSQESSVTKSLGTGDSSLTRYASFTAQTRGVWIPVTSTGMREREAIASHLPDREGVI